MRWVAIIALSIASGVLALLAAAVFASALLIGFSGAKPGETVGWDPVSLLMQTFGLSMNAAFVTFKVLAVAVPLVIFAGGCALGFRFFSTRVHANPRGAGDN